MVLLLPMAAFADGKVLPTALAASEVTIPDQRALIHYTNGTERLVIETRFVGSGTNFAWVIPLPSPPLIEKATTGLFPTLDYLFRPQVFHFVPAYYLGMVAFLVGAYFTLVIRCTGRLTYLDVGACGVAWVALAINQPVLGFSILGFLTFLILLGLAALIRHGYPATAVVLAFALVFFGFSLMSPTMSRAGASKGATSTSAAEAVDVLEKSHVGVFETTTISSKDPRALEAWLSQNGFMVPTNSRPVIESYVREGWVFVAAKVGRDTAEAETSAAHPLSFTFKTEKPVYPMRLTGVDNGPVSVDLYVFGPSRAKARHFTAKRSTRPDYPAAPNYWQRWNPERPAILHPLLRNWVAGSPVATKLSATLTPAQMKSDVWLDWTFNFEKKSHVYSRHGALIHSLNWGVGTFTALICLALTLHWVVLGRERYLPLLTRYAGAAFLGTTVLIGGIYLFTDKTQVRLVGNPASQTQSSLYYCLSTIEEEFLASSFTNAGAQLRYTASDEFENLVLGGYIREEDSPGNFTLRQNSNGVDFVTYDAQGAEHVVRQWPSRTP